MINSRTINDLNPLVQPMAQAFIAECRAQGIDVIITSTYRDKASQDALYAQGRTRPGPKVTNAQAGQSFHNYAVAFDFVPVVNGKADWNNTRTWRQCGEIAESAGLEWAGRWNSFKELCHCQYTGGLSLPDFQGGKRPA